MVRAGDGVGQDAMHGLMFPGGSKGESLDAFFPCLLQTRSPLLVAWPRAGREYGMLQEGHTGRG